MRESNGGMVVSRFQESCADLEVNSFDADIDTDLEVFNTEEVSSCEQWNGDN